MFLHHECHDKNIYAEYPYPRFMRSNTPNRTINALLSTFAGLCYVLVRSKNPKRKVPSTHAFVMLIVAVREGEPHKVRLGCEFPKLSCVAKCEARVKWPNS